MTFPPNCAILGIQMEQWQRAKLPEGVRVGNEEEDFEVVERGVAVVEVQHTPVDVRLKDGWNVTSIIELPKNKTLRLNTVLKTGDNIVAIPGFRYDSGCLEAPMIFVRGKWFNAIFLSSESVDNLYKEVVGKLKEGNFWGKYPLNRKEVACENLLKSRSFLKCYPELVGKL